MEKIDKTKIAKGQMKYVIKLMKMAKEKGFEDGKKFLYDYYFKKFKKPVIIEKEHLEELGFPEKDAGFVKRVKEK